MKIVSSDKLYIAQSKIPYAERGVYANVAIKKGEVIERCPIIEIPQPDFESLGDSILINYFYFFGKKKERVLFALGFGSLYNHDYAPNAKYKINAKEKTIVFTSLRKINKDEEITVNYNQANLKSPPLWFEH